MEDKSGLGTPEALSDRESTDFIGLGTDDMQLKPRRFEKDIGDNLPLSDSKRTSVFQHQDTFVSGFEEMMRFIVRHRKRIAQQLEIFDGLSSRFVFRPTQLYADLIEEANHPDLMRNGARRSIHFDIVKSVS